MKRRLVGLLGLAACAQPAPTVPSIAITNVTVIDGTGAPPQSGVTVVVTGDRIAAIGAAAKVPRGATRVDGTGKFVIPGLWDMHYHADNDTANQRRFMAMNIANGVVGVREMFGSPSILALKRKVEAGEVLGSRMVLGSPIVDGPNPYWPGSAVVDSPAAADSVVGALKASGAEFIKVYMLLPRATFFAVLRAAKARGLNVVGHVPYDVSAEEASDSGMRTMEHFYDIPFSTATNAASLHARAAKLLAGDRRAGFGTYNRLIAEATANYDSAAAARLAVRFKQNNTWQVPTLGVIQGMGRIGAPDFDKDPAFRYMPEGMQKMWSGIRSAFPTWREEDWVALKKGFDSGLLLTGAMHRAGVDLLAGTDTPNPGLYPGFSLHRELELLVQAGLTPLEALQTATLNPARYLGATDSLGTVGAGKVADLVLLDANPLDNISNTQRIAGVVYRGAYRDRAALQALLNF
jgi:imidazolonepropionase-like amidohydrolase